MVKNTSTVKAPALKDYKPYVAKLDAQKGNEINRVIPALKGNAKIKDNRQQFNY